MPQKQPKIFVAQKMKAQLIPVELIKWLKKFCSGCKNLDNHTSSARPKTVDFKAVLQAIKANPVISTRRLSGKLDIS